MNALEVKNLIVSYSHHPEKIVDGVSFTIEQGQFAMLIGPNGSGKTTLIKAILGLLSYIGEIKVLGKDVKEVYSEIGFLPQRFSFDRSLPITVSEVVAMPLTTCSRDCEHKKIGPLKALSLVKSADLVNEPLRNLSGGQLQKVLLARALVHSPRLLILDEPEAGVDIQAEENLYDLLKNLSRSGITILVASHEVELVLQYADWVLCLNKKLVCNGPPTKALNSQVFAELYGKHLGLYHHHHHDKYHP